MGEISADCDDRGDHEEGALAGIEYADHEPGRICHRVEHVVSLELSRLAWARLWKRPGIGSQQNPPFPTRMSETCGMVASVPPTSWNFSQGSLTGDPVEIRLCIYPADLREEALMGGSLSIQFPRTSEVGVAETTAMIRHGIDILTNALLSNNAANGIVE